MQPNCYLCFFFVKSQDQLAALALVLAMPPLPPPPWWQQVLVAMEILINKLTLHLLEWVQWNDVAGENYHPSKDPDPRPYIIWDSPLLGDQIQPIPIWIQPTMEQVCKYRVFHLRMCFLKGVKMSENQYLD